MIGQPAGPTVSASGSVATPAAGATIATIPFGSLAADLYSVQVQLAYRVAAGVVNNLQLLKGATVIVTPIMPVAAPSTQALGADVVVQLDGATALNVKTIGADAAATVDAVIIATPIKG